MTRPDHRLRVLVLSWNYPSPASPQRGLWVERMCDAATSFADISVIVPTPWVPPLVPVQAIARFRRVPRHEKRNEVEVHFPRVLGSIDYHTHAFDAGFASRRVLQLARRLHAKRPFDLIHAHFIYPDGVVASRLGKELGIPVMTSEHAFWRPWLIDRKRVGKQVDGALPGIRVVAPVSEFLREDVDEHAAGRVESIVLPNVVDEITFSPAPAKRDPNQLLYVGLVRGFKRLDVLIRALALARESVPELHLKILSAKSYAYSRDRREMHGLVASLGLQSAVEVITGSSPREVAEAMRRCAFVVVSSARHETFCSVAAESLACGTPLIITRCGGPEEFVTPDDGVMVEADDPIALAEGILEGSRRRGTFDADDIRRRIVGRFGREAWCRRARTAYERLAGEYTPEAVR